MPSLLAWVDHDADARDRTLRILSLFQERESRDELGLGGVRDSFADQLFPGTSTIQTRLRVPAPKPPDSFESFGCRFRYLLLTNQLRSDLTALSLSASLSDCAEFDLSGDPGRKDRRHQA